MFAKLIYIALLVSVLAVAATAQGQTATFFDVNDALPNRCYDAATTTVDPLNPNRLIIGINSDPDVNGCVAFADGGDPSSTMDTVSFLISAPANFYIATVRLNQPGETISASGSQAFRGATWVVDDDAHVVPTTSTGWAATIDLTGLNKQTVPVQLTTFVAAAANINRTASASASNPSIVVELLPLNPADTTPDAFSFTAQTGVALSSTRTSNSITVTGINAATAISIASGSYSINGGAFTSAAGIVNNGDTVTVRLTSSANFSTQTCATVTIGGVQGQFCATTLAADTSPDAFSFTAQTGVALSSLITSNTVTVTGINAAAPISITGGSYRINSGAFTSVSGNVNNGDMVTVRLTSSANLSTQVCATLTIGGVQGQFCATTLTADTTPDAFSFTAQTGVALSTAITSNSITVAGINSAAPISITGGSYRINNGAFTSTPGNVNNGNTVTLQLTSSANFSTQGCATLTIGGIQDQFCATTLAAPPPVQVAAISQLSPAAAPAHGPSFTLLVTGTNFVPGAVFRWNDQARVTTFLSPTQLSAEVSAADVAAQGSATVTVVNPNTNASNGLTFTIVDASASPAPVINAQADRYKLSVRRGGVTRSVLSNDKLDRKRASSTTVQIAILSALPTGVTFDTGTGKFSLALNGVAGTYPVAYQICEIANAGNCDIAIATLTLKP